MTHMFVKTQERLQEHPEWQTSAGERLLEALTLKGPSTQQPYLLTQNLYYNGFFGVLFKRLVGNKGR